MIEQGLLRSHSKLGSFIWTSSFFESKLLHSVGIDYSRGLASWLSPIFQRIGASVRVDHFPLRSGDFHFSDGWNLVSTPLTASKRRMLAVSNDQIAPSRISLTLFVKWASEIGVGNVLRRNPISRSLPWAGTVFILVIKWALSEIETPNIRRLLRLSWDGCLELPDIVIVLDDLDRLLSRLLIRWQDRSHRSTTMQISGIILNASGVRLFHGSSSECFLGFFFLLFYFASSFQMGNFTFCDKLLVGIFILLLFRCRSLICRARPHFNFKIVEEFVFWATWWLRRKVVTSGVRWRQLGYLVSGSFIKFCILVA